MAEHLTSGGGTTAQPDGFHILAELVSAEGLTSPIKASGRIKYTCIAVSKHYIGLGASSGSLYVFHRSTLKYLQVFSNIEGALTRVAFAPDDNVVGIATSQGLVITWELNIERRDRSARLAVSSAHRNGHVTAMIWDTASERLFSGDNHGRITFLNVYHRKMSGLFKLPTELVMDADSAIVQLDYCDDKLLASTTTKCFICDTKKKQAYAVGTKLRDGQFGACFLQKATKEFPLVYSARPGSRIWEVNIVGQVQATHQFKHLLAVPSLPVFGPGLTPVLQCTEHVQKPQSQNFAQLLTFGHGRNLLLTWNTKAIYVFDPEHIKVIVWSSDFKDILWACVYKSRVYCLHANSQVRCYTMLSAERCISKLFALSLWEQCAQAAIYFAERVKRGNARRYVPRSLIQEVNYQLMDGNADFRLIGRMEELLSNMEEDGLSTPGSSRRSSLDSFEGLRLDSGIYLVRKRAGSDDSVEDVPIQNVRPVVVDQETQMDDGFVGYEAKHDWKFDSQDNEDATVISNDEVQVKLFKLEEARHQETAALACDEDVEVTPSGLPHTEVDGEEEVVDGPGELMEGPAGINWVFGHGRLVLRRENSLLEEIAEETDKNQMDALVKGGELDTSIAESLNYTDDTPVTDTHADPHADNLGDDRTANYDRAEATVSESNHGNQDDLASQNEACGMARYDDASPLTSASNCCGAKTSLTTYSDNSPHSSNDAISSYLGSGDPVNSVPFHSATDRMGMEPVHDKHAADSCGQSTDVSYHTAQDHSQMGTVIPNGAFSKSVSGGENPSLAAVRNLRPDHLPIALEEGFMRSDNDVDFKIGQFSVEETEDLQSDWPAVQRSLSMPTASQHGRDMNKRRGRIQAKQLYPGKEKKHSKKSRIIDFDNSEVFFTDNPSENDPTFALTAAQKDPPQWPSRNPPSSTPTKRSLSLSSVSSSLLSPSSSPSRVRSHAEFPPYSEMDFPSSSSFSNDAMMGPFDSHEEMFWGGSHMLFAMSGPKIAAQLLAPSFSAMKESLSSKLGKTKIFLKQMSEPGVESLPAEVAVTSATQPDVLSQNVPRDPSLDHALAPQPPSSNTPSTDFTSLSAETVSQQSLSSGMSFLKAASLEAEAGVSEVCFDEDNAKADYCTGLNDDDVIKKLAMATWEAKQKLQDASLLLSIDGCHDILEKWLHELQVALASKHYPLQTESYGEVQTAKTLTEDTNYLFFVSVKDLHDELANDRAERSASTSGDDCPVQSNDCLESRDPIDDSHMSSYCITDELRNNNVHVHPTSSCQLSDPFGFPRLILEDLSKLAMLCFEMGTFGSDITLASSTVQSDRLSDNERSVSSFQDGESSSPETDQSRPVLDPNTNALHPTASVLPSLTGSQGSTDRMNQSHSSSDNVQQHDVIDNSSQQCISIETESSLISEQDKRAASFVTSFFFLLEVERVREILKLREGWRRQTMAAILDCLEVSEGESESADGVSRFVQAIKMDTQKGNRVNLFFIHRLIQHGHAEMALDNMLESFPDLVPWEAMYLTQADTVPSNLFMDYVIALLDSVEAMDRDTMMASICSDQEVKCHLLTSALSHGAPSAAELFCTCGNLPRPGSHMNEWQYGTIADKILSLPAASKDRLLSVCIKQGYWPGVLKLCLDLQQSGQALKIALQLADWKHFSKEGVMPMNMDEWILLLNLMSSSQPVSPAILCLACSALLLTKQDNHWLMAQAANTSLSDESCDWTRDRSSKPECDWIIDRDGACQDGNMLQSNWSPSVTWERISTLLVKSVGPGLAVRMLQDTCVPYRELPREFFKDCIQTSIIEKHERDVCLSILEGLDTYLWSKRNTTLSPPLYHQILQEQTLMMSNEEAVGPDDSSLKVPSPDNISQESLQFLEDHDCHWGTSILLNSECEVCGLALSSSVSTKTPGLLAFPCGHTFHSACVVEKACLLCYEFNCHKTRSESLNL